MTVTSSDNNDEGEDDDDGCSGWSLCQLGGAADVVTDVARYTPVGLAIEYGDDLANGLQEAGQFVVDNPMLVAEVAIGFTPLGVVLDGRDALLAVRDCFGGASLSSCATGVGLASVGFIPGGDIIKGGRRILQNSDEAVDILQAGVRSGDDVAEEGSGIFAWRRRRRADDPDETNNNLPTTLFGHGGWSPQDGTFVVPEGTAVSIYPRFGDTMAFARVSNYGTVTRWDGTYVDAPGVNLLRGELPEIDEVVRNGTLTERHANGGMTFHHGLGEPLRLDLTPLDVRLQLSNGDVVDGPASFLPGTEIPNFAIHDGRELLELPFHTPLPVDELDHVIFATGEGHLSDYVAPNMGPVNISACAYSACDAIMPGASNVPNNVDLGPLE